MDAWTLGQVQKVWQARLTVVQTALLALYEAEGHEMHCQFSRCTCGAVQRRVDARGQAAKVLRQFPSASEAPQ